MGMTILVRSQSQWQLHYSNEWGNGDTPISRGCANPLIYNDFAVPELVAVLLLFTAGMGLTELEISASGTGLGLAR